MRVLQIHNQYQYRGGEDTVVANEYKLLKENGAEVFQLLFNNTKISPLKLANNAKSDKIVLKNLEIHKPDVVHIHNLFYEATPGIIETIYKQGVPLIMTLHNYRLLCANGMFLREGNSCRKCQNLNFQWPAVKHKCFKDSHLKTFGLSSAIYIHSLRKTWGLVDKYIVLNQFAKQQFINSKLPIEKEKYVIKPNSTDSNNQKANQTERKEFIFVGRLSSEKGVDVLVEAFNKIPEIPLKIIGEGPQFLQLKEKAKGNIKFLGKLPFSEVKNHLKNAKALVFPSLVFEGLPNTILEAFSAGIPVICSNNENLKTIVKDKVTGLFFEEGNPEDLKEKIFKFDQEPNPIWYINARNEFESYYTHKKNFEALMSIYEQTISYKKKNT